MTPLAATAAALDAADPYVQVRLGWPDDPSGWVRCADVDPAFVADWEARIEAFFVAAHARSHPQTVAGYALDYYASVPSAVGAAALRLARRVPRLDPASLAFGRHPEWHYPDRVALLDERFWCLPADPAAGHPAATVVPDEAALAAVLRAQVRRHADGFLAGWTGAARLPRRHRLAAFADGLQGGLCGREHPADAEELVVLAATVLPGRTAEFDQTSTVGVLLDDRGRRHLTRRRAGCCYWYKLAEGGEACVTCPRTPDAARPRRYAELV